MHANKLILDKLYRTKKKSTNLRSFNTSRHRICLQGLGIHEVIAPEQDSNLDVFFY